MITRSMDNSHHGTHVLGAWIDTQIIIDHGDAVPTWHYQISIDHGDAVPNESHLSSIISEQFGKYDDCVIAMNEHLRRELIPSPVHNH